MGLCLRRLRLQYPRAGVAGFNRNQWQLSSGISGNLRLESVAGFDRNQWQPSRGIRTPAALGPARGGPAPSHAPISTGLALGPGVPDYRPALAPSLAVGAGALARHPSMRGA